MVKTSLTSGAIDKCTRLLKQITEEERNIESFDRSNLILFQCQRRALLLMIPI
jgi:hypothetical protein